MRFFNSEKVEALGGPNVVSFVYISIWKLAKFKGAPSKVHHHSLLVTFFWTVRCKDYLRSGLLT